MPLPLYHLSRSYRLLDVEVIRIEVINDQTHSTL